MATSRITGTNEQISTYGAGQTYTALATWESATDIGLVAANQSQVLACLAASYNDLITFAGATTDATRFRIIRPQASNFHTGVRDTGVRFYYSTTNANVFNLTEAFVSLQDLVIKATVNSGSSFACITGSAACDGFRIIGCILTNGQNSGAGVISGFTQTGAAPGVIANCIAENNEQNQFSTTGSNSSTISIYNCTAIGGVNGFNNVVSSTFDLKNCLAHGSSTSDFTTAGTQTRTNCASEDATATGTGCRASQTFTFVNAGSNDYHLASGDAGAKGFGTDLSADGTFAFNDDIDRVTITTWSIGFDSLVATSDITAQATIALTTAADLDATGTLASAATVAISATAVLNAPGPLIAAASVSLSATADLDAIGQLASAATLAITATADLTGPTNPGAMTAAASIALTAAADLDATGALTAAATLALSTAADLDATGSLVAAATLSVTTAVDLDAIANIAAAAAIAITITADLTSPAANDMSVAAVLSLTTSADIDAIGNMAAAATLALTVSANLGDPRMVAAATLAISVTADLDAIGSLAAAGSLALTTSAALQGGGPLVAAAAISVSATASLTGAGELDAQATIDITASVVLDALGNLVSVALIQFTVSATVVDANADQLPPINNPGAISGGAYLGARTGTLVLDTVSTSALRGGRTTTITKGAASSSVRRDLVKTL